MLRIVVLTTVLLLATVTLCPAQIGSANGAAMGACVDGRHQVSMDLEFYEFSSPLPVGVVFLRETIGACRAAEFVPDEPLPVTVPDPPPFYFEESVSADFDVPEAGAIYRYTPYIVYDDGQRLQTNYQVPTTRGTGRSSVAGTHPSRAARSPRGSGSRTPRT